MMSPTIDMHARRPAKGPPRQVCLLDQCNQFQGFQQGGVCETSMQRMQARTGFAAHPAALDGVNGVGKAGRQALPVLLQAQAELGRCQLDGSGRRVCPIDGIQEGQVRALPCTSPHITIRPAANPILNLASALRCQIPCTIQ